MQIAFRQAETPQYEALINVAKTQGLRSLETTVLRFPSVNANYAACSATLEAADGATYKEVARRCCFKFGDAQAKALELACQRAKSKALESFTGIKCEVETIPSAPSRNLHLRLVRHWSNPPGRQRHWFCLLGHVRMWRRDIPGNHEFSTNLFKRPLCVPCQINIAASR